MLQEPTSNTSQVNSTPLGELILRSTDIAEHTTLLLKNSFTFTADDLRPLVLSQEHNNAQYQVMNGGDLIATAFLCNLNRALKELGFVNAAEIIAKNIVPSQELNMKRDFDANDKLLTESFSSIPEIEEVIKIARILRERWFKAIDELSTRPAARESLKTISCKDPWPLISCVRDLVINTVCAVTFSIEMADSTKSGARF